MLGRAADRTRPVLAQIAGELRGHAVETCLPEVEPCLAGLLGLVGVSLPGRCQARPLLLEGGHPPGGPGHAFGLCHALAQRLDPSGRRGGLGQCGGGLGPGPFAVVASPRELAALCGDVREAVAGTRDLGVDVPDLGLHGQQVLQAGHLLVPAPRDRGDCGDRTLRDGSLIEVNAGQVGVGRRHSGPGGDQRGEGLADVAECGVVDLDERMGRGRAARELDVCGHLLGAVLERP